MTTLLSDASKTPAELADRLIEAFPAHSFAQLFVSSLTLNKWVGADVTPSFLGVVNEHLAQWSLEDDRPLVVAACIHAPKPKHAGLLVTSDLHMFVSTVQVDDDAKVLAEDVDEGQPLYLHYIDMESDDGFNYKYAVLQYGANIELEEDTTLFLSQQK